MSIWIHDESRSPNLVQSFDDQCQICVCAFCGSALSNLSGTDLIRTIIGGTGPRVLRRAIDLRGYANERRKLLEACPVCGWWVASSIDTAAPYETHDGGYLHLRRACGILKELDVRDVSIPTDELRRYLVAKYGDRFYIHPRKYEEIVGSVFADFGLRIRVTSFSGDEGIDVIVFDGAGDATVGIQVKRQQGKVTAEQIRSFVGALVLKGLTKGIYVTTSSYQSGAGSVAATANDRLAIAVSLMDAQRFYEALKITSCTTHLSPDDRSSPYFRRWTEMDAAPLVYSSSW